MTSTGRSKTTGMPRTRTRTRVCIYVQNCVNCARVGNGRVINYNAYVIMRFAR